MRPETRWGRAAALAVVLLAWGAMQAFAQTPVTWTASSTVTRVTPGQTFTIDVVARIQDGWHIYALTQPPPPIATRITVPEGQTIVSSGPVAAPAAKVEFDGSFGIDTELYSGDPVFRVPVTLGADAPLGPRTVAVQAYFQACNSTLCMPPRRVIVALGLDVLATAGGPSGPARSSAPAVPPSATAGPAVASPQPIPPAAAEPPPVPPRAGAAAAPGAPAPRVSSGLPVVGGRSIWSFVWLAMSVGALSLLTPCAFPMVPITVSYFTNHAAGSRRKAAQQAGVYMAGIILTFTALGMALALLLGATSLNRFAANPWVNLGITAIFLAFALSLFGIFDLRAPTALVTRLDALTRRPGGGQTAATLLMGLTFTLTSFTCTAPFIGTLLVMAAGGDWVWPLVGMLAFSTVFALPFFVLALMPQWMARLPRAGGWLNSVKVMMAFLEVAAAMKFISNVDLVWGWGVFTRDIVLAAWVVIGVLMALYVIGQFRFKHDAPVQHVGLVRLTSALLCGTLALWLMTGLFGKRLGEIEAFLPPAEAAAAEPAGGGIGELAWITNDFEAALARAREERRPLFIDFTGYTCTNCRWMEANMFTRADVRRELQHYVLARLYTDGEGAVYTRQQALQQARYQTVALPFYAVVDPAGRDVASFSGLTRDPAPFIAFLKQGRGVADAVLPAGN